MIVGYKRACERSAAYMKRVQETEQSTYVSHDCFSNLHPSIIDEHMKTKSLPISSLPPSLFQFPAHFLFNRDALGGRATYNEPFSRSSSFQSQIPSKQSKSVSQ